MAQAFRHDSYGRTNGSKIFGGECATRVGSPTPRMSGALGDGPWMTCMARNSDIVLLSCHAPLFVDVSKLEGQGRSMQWATLSGWRFALQVSCFDASLDRGGHGARTRDWLDSAFSLQHSAVALNIPEHRKAIDRLDTQIVRLLNDRTRHVLAIGEIKLKAGEEIYVPHRERAVLQRICHHNHGPMTDDQLRAVYREIMSSALALEKTLTIAYLGPEATFTHQAAIRRFGSSLRYAAQKTIADVFTEVSKNRADYGVVPVENSTEGVVTHTLDMFVDSDLKVVSQIVLPVQQCLLSNSRRAQIQKLFAHPQSLGQCRGWVQNHLPRVEIIETSSNARSAEFAARQKNTAAIAGLLAAEKYKLRVLEFDIQDNAANATRFLVLGRQCSPPTGKDRTSLMVSIADRVGALHHALAAFRRYRINMTKIESRPSKRKAWEYFFFIDCDGHYHDQKVAKAIVLLEQECSYVKVLGSYPNAE